MVSWSPYETPIELLLYYYSMLIGFKAGAGKTILTYELSPRIGIYLVLTSSVS
jgi:hypothetical protein